MGKQQRQDVISSRQKEEEGPSSASSVSGANITTGSSGTYAASASNAIAPLTPDAVAVTESFSVFPPPATSSSSSSTHTHSSKGGTQALDYIGTSKAVKNIFSLPYAPDKSVSVGIHNVDGCLLIDADPLAHTEPTAAPRSLLSELNLSESGKKSTKEETNSVFRSANSIVALPPLSPVLASNDSQQSAAALSAINTMFGQENSTKRRNTTGKTENASSSSHQISLREHYGSEPREYVPWNFRDIKMLVGSDAMVYRSSAESSLTVRIEDAAEMREQLSTHQNMKRNGLFIPDRDFAQLQQQSGKRSYADALRTRKLMADDNNQQEEKQEEEERHSSVPPSSFSVPDLGQVKLQTCIVPSVTSFPLGGAFTTTNTEPAPTTTTPSSAPVCTVIDAYLDNIISNVPQLALCLREKGFVQSVKLLNTAELPSSFMKENTFDTSNPFEVITDNNRHKGNNNNLPNSSNNNGDDQIFSPTIMDMNASTLLRFLKDNCTKDNATYLLHREAGQTNIQLYDVSSISNQRQRKWSWWLATMSYRFALRLRHLSMHIEKEMAPGMRRTFRARSRSLFMNTLTLLEDMEGPTHENFIAEVCEKIAESFLQHNEDGTNTTGGAAQSTEREGAPANVPSPATSSDSSQRLYSSIPSDSLVKAQDYLSRGIKTVWKSWEATCKEMEQIEERKPRKARNERRRRLSTTRYSSLGTSEQRPVTVVSTHQDSSSSEEDEDDDDFAFSESLKRSVQLKSEAIATQLYSMHDTHINVSLRLAEGYLNNYFSSSLMNALRATARRMADTTCLFGPLEKSPEDTAEKHLLLSRWRHALQLQYTRLWELSGHFARSFAADFHWRDRGHAAGDDVISVLRDVEAAFPYSYQMIPIDSNSLRSGSSSSSPKASVSESLFLSNFDWHSSGLVDEIEAATKGLDGDLTGIVCQSREDNHLVGKMNRSDLDSARSLLEAKKQIQRDRRRVLIAASLSYKRAMIVYEGALKVQSADTDEEEPQPEGNAVASNSALLNLLRQRLGDSCNEIGKVLLDELRAVLASTQDQNPEDTSTIDKKRAAEPLLSSAEFWFSLGINAFEGCKDLRNAALLRANVCQCYKLRANATFASTTKVQHSKSNQHAAEKPTHAELCLQEAADQLLAAHESLGERETDPMTWDMISNELAATYLVLGVRRRQGLLGGGSAPLLLHAVRLSPGQERSIISPMEKALAIYEQSGNAHQAAAVHYQLALFYSKIWTCQRDENKTREKLSAAFEHYKAAHTYFFNAIRGNEPTFILLSLDICSLYSTVSGEECLKHALLRCLDTADAFSKQSIDIHTSPDQKPEVRKEWLGKMKTLASSVEDRLFKTLQSLVKLAEKTPDAAAAVGKIDFKELYRVALSAKLKAPSSITNDDSEDDFPESVKALLCLHSILKSVQEGYNSSAAVQSNKE